MSILAPVYSGPVSMVTTIANLRGLPANNAIGFGPFDMNSARAVDFQLSVDLSSTATSAYRLDIGIMISPEGTTWPGYMNTAQFQANTRLASVPAGIIPIASLVPSYNTMWSATLGRFFGTMPQYFGVVIVNNTNVALDGSYTHRVYGNFIQYEYV